LVIGLGVWVGDQWGVCHGRASAGSAQVTPYGCDKADELEPLATVFATSLHLSWRLERFSPRSSWRAGGLSHDVRRRP